MLPFHQWNKLRHLFSPPKRIKMAQSLFLWQMDLYLKHALQLKVITYKEAQQLAFFELIVEAVPSGELLEVPKHLWPVLDRISLSQTQGTRQ
ncbi:MAG: hypothetical protein A2143_09245 [Gallionellales bacterium RBG_16_57_15]|nr:MAG: hypothetical protein A2143_09245 [Gallionellales bacterium RBG_16_57_15]